MRKYFFLLLFLKIIVVSAQNLGNPLDIPMVLSGNFGELRSNHFHAGIDVKTPEGTPVFSVEEGFISRIKVGATGYGKAIYITHTNGLTSVYGHLQKFSPKIEAFVKKKQYEKKSFEVELFLKDVDLQLNKGDVIAYTGNTGSSAGPHLHFEIRDTKTQKVLNPERFGYHFFDEIPPKILALYAYSLDEYSAINNNTEPQQLFFTRQPDGSFLADKITAKGFIGFGVQAVDLKNFTNNIYGVYKASISVNGQVILAYVFDDLSFENDHYINTFIDYAQYKNTGKQIQLFYKKQGNKLPFYTQENEKGVVKVVENQWSMVTISLEDFKGNSTVLNIPIEGKVQKTNFKEQVLKNLIAKRDNLYKTKGAEVYFSANTFYENTAMQIIENNGVLSVIPNDIPVAKSYLIRFKKSEIAEIVDDKKFFIAYINPKTKQKSFVKTFRNKDYFSCDTKLLGDFTIASDTILPTIQPINFQSGNEITSLQTLNIQILDDFSGIGQYQVFVDNRWVLAEYDVKNKMLQVDVNEIVNLIEKDTFVLKIEVSDRVNNTKTIEIPLMATAVEVLSM